VGCRLELTRAVWPAEQSLTTGSLRQNTPIKKKKNLTEQIKNKIESVG
jgi:hypothetical protein